MNCKLFSKSGVYKNKKTGKEYRVLFTGINTTNAQDGQEMVAYTDGVQLYFRETNEFFEKFK